MSAQRDATAAYAASCNPPRRAKRHRTASLVGQEGPAGPAISPDKSQQRRPARPPILPKQPQAAGTDYHIHPSPDSDSASEEEDEYDPGRDAAPAPKRRGRKPGAMSRSARESLRKLNHSKIEKARRTKINETLAALSTLVNDRGRVLAGNPFEQANVTKEDEGSKGGKKGKGKAEEKEFKLDVLVKTVEYMQDLVARVKTLEETRCSQCRAAERPSPKTDAVRGTTPLKRKRADEVEDTHSAARNKRAYPRQDEDDSYVGDDEHGLTNGAEEELPSPLPFVPKTSTSTSPGAVTTTSSPRLPPIASWLPHPYVDPSSLMSASPSAGPSRSPTNAQLPSPPASERFRPTATLANMPALTLPGPAHPLTLPQGAGQNHRATGAGVVPPRQQRKSVSASPSVSPTWTPEDESAASLLLQMSSKPSSTASSSRSPPTMMGSLGVLSPREERVGPVPVQGSRALEVVTPGSLLGMRD
ncbi:hypothetical protein OH77DRAFT_1582784 [Trametes cingulata]|nr:hypothetical protein OH77DRAFT_1582784 [Trametes cingulata]